MTNQWKRTLSGIVVLAMLLSCAAVNVFAAAEDLTENDFTLSVEQTGTLVTVKLIGTKEVTGWGGGKGTLSVANATGTDVTNDFTLNSLTTNVGDKGTSGWAWTATTDDTDNGDTITANTVWAQYSLTASDKISTGSYTFSMTFTDGDNIDKDANDYAVSGKTIKTTKTLTFAKGYTVTLTDGVEGTAEINPNATFDMKVVVSGAGFNGMQAEIGYDTSLFTLNSVTGSITNSNTDTDGVVSMYLLSKDIVASGETVAILSFTAKDLGTGETEKTGSFTIAKGTADDMAGFASQDAQDATLVGDAVKVATQKSYTITVDDTVTHGTVGVSATTANVGDTITLTANPATGYELDAFTVTTESGTDVTVTDSKFTMPAENVTVSATFTPKDYAVTLNGNDLSGAATANYGTDYVATVANYDPSAYDYTLAVTIGGTQYTEASISTDGKITIPGNKITGAIVITLTKTEKPFTVTTVDNYVTGATLVLVTGTNLNQYGYTYSGNPMFYVEKYQAYAYVVVGAVNSSNVAAATSGTPTTISAGYDVNNTGKVDFNDAGAAFGCYNVSYTIADNVVLYLRADVNGDKKVDTADVSAIMENYTADSTNGEA